MWLRFSTSSSKERPSERPDYFRRPDGGQLRTARVAVQGPYGQHWRLDHALSLAWSAAPRRLTLEPFCLRSRNTAACSSGRVASDGPILSDDLPIIEYFLSMPKGGPEPNPGTMKGVLTDVYKEGKYQQ